MQPASPASIRGPGAIVLCYASGQTLAPAKTPLWILVALAPSMANAFLDFAWSISPLDVLTEVAVHALRVSSWDDLGLASLAFGVALPLAIVPAAFLPGRFPRLGSLARFPVLLLTLLGLLACGILMALMLAEPPGRTRERAIFATYSAILCLGLLPAAVLLIRRRRAPMLPVCLFVLTCCHLACAAFALISFYRSSEAGYQLVAASVPFHAIHAAYLFHRHLWIRSLATSLIAVDHAPVHRP